ncbi:MAG: PQQ-dependent sugar dehydrogenase [Chthoniobacterales bacterium]
MKTRGIFAGCLVMALGARLSMAQLPDVPTGTISVETQVVASGLNSPVEVVPVNDGSGRLFIVEQGGRIKILRNGAVNATPFLDLASQIAAGGEKGLLGFAFHPGFSNPGSPGFGRFYTYTTETPNGAADFTVPMTGSPDSRCVIAEWQVSLANPDIADPASRRDVLRFTHPQSNHNAGKIAFRPSDGYLYIASGDGGAGGDTGDGHTPGIGNGQNITNLLGKILRIDPLAPSQNPPSTDPLSANGRYRVPAGNPFVGAAGLGEIYAYGFRNPYRFSFDPVADLLIVGDVGQNAIEEVDVVERGRNYGWRRKEGSFLYNGGNVTPDPSPDPALINPVLEYDHGDGISVIGGFVYRGSAIPALQGRYVFGDFLKPAIGSGRLFYGDLARRIMEELRLGISPRLLAMNIKGFGVDTAGEIYVVGDASGGSGEVRKLVPIPAVPALLNLSTRARVEADNNGLAIAGFIVTGSVPKTVVVRGLGPSLAVNGQPLAGRLLNPSLTLQDGNGATIEANDDWMTGARAGELAGFGLAPSNTQESAVVATVPPGVFTATLRGVGGTTGVALVELYDVAQGAPANAVNLSTRGRVQAGDDVMIGGVIIGGGTTQRVILRAIGPALTGRGVVGALQDPTLELVNASGARIRFNDDWRSEQEAAIIASGVPPTENVESAIIETLSPGSYTAIVRGAGGTTGVALVEAFRLNP